jgi:hypothetical protein
MRRGALFMLVVSLGLLTAMGCWNPFSSDDGGGGGGGGKPDIDRTNPDKLLNFFAYAYENQDIELYREALDDYFEFEFTEDVADSLGLPEDTPWWGKEEDVQSTLNMFNAEDVQSVSIILAEVGVGAPWEDCTRRFINGDPPETTYINGLCKDFEPDIKVTVDEGDEPTIYWVNTSYLAIMVRVDPHDPGLWTILRIKETLKPAS